MLSALIRQARPAQHVKQAFVIAPSLYLIGNITPKDFQNLFLATIAFSLMSTAVYCNNDLNNIFDDRKSIFTNARPLSSGAISRKVVAVFGITCLFLSFLAVFPLKNILSLSILLLAYLLINIAYTNFNLKNVEPLSSIIVSIGYSIRFQVGTSALELKASYWGLTISFLIAFLMITGKKIVRESHEYPPKEFGVLQSRRHSLDILISIVYATYLVFITNPQTEQSWFAPIALLSSVPLVFALLSYRKLVYRGMTIAMDINEQIIRDKAIIISVLFWAIVMVISRFAV